MTHYFTYSISTLKGSCAKVAKVYLLRWIHITQIHRARAPQLIFINTRHPNSASDILLVADGWSHSSVVIPFPSLNPYCQDRFLQAKSLMKTERAETPEDLFQFKNKEHYAFVGTADRWKPPSTSKSVQAWAKSCPFPNVSPCISRTLALDHGVVCNRRPTKAINVHDQTVPVMIVTSSGYTEKISKTKTSTTGLLCYVCVCFVHEWIYDHVWWMIYVSLCYLPFEAPTFFLLRALRCLRHVGLVSISRTGFFPRFFFRTWSHCTNSWGWKERRRKKTLSIRKLLCHKRSWRWTSM